MKQAGYHILSDTGVTYVGTYRGHGPYNPPDILHSIESSLFEPSEFSLLWIVSASFPEFLGLCAASHRSVPHWGGAFPTMFSQASQSLARTFCEVGWFLYLLGLATFRAYSRPVRGRVDVLWEQAREKLSCPNSRSVISPFWENLEEARLHGGLAILRQSGQPVGG